MRTLELEQRSEAWRQWRLQGITATESGVILGQNPYITPWRLWCEKTGREEPEDLSDNPLVQFGIQHEEHVRQLFESKHSEVLFPTCAEFDEDPIFRASFDGLTSALEPVEIKCPSDATLRSVRSEGLSSEACALYSTQLQHQLMVSGAKRGWLIFFDPVADDILEFQLVRDELLIQELRQKGREFWEKYLVLDKEPPKDPQRDIFVPKTEDEISRWCHNAADYRLIDQQIVELQRQIDELNAAKKHYRDNLISMMGSFKYADFAGIALTQRCSRGSVDYKKLLATKGIGENEINAYRNQPSKSWLVRLTDSPMPLGFNDADMKASIDAVDVAEAMWF